MRNKGTARSALLSLCAVRGLLLLFVVLLMALFASGEPQTSIHSHKQDLDVYRVGPIATPTTTPCASVGTWIEQAPYPIAVSGNAVASVGGNIYSFGGIANNVAIPNAYTYNPASNTWTPIASLPQTTRLV
jgi:hypothetical protein